MLKSILANIKVLKPDCSLSIKVFSTKRCERNNLDRWMWKVVQYRQEGFSIVIDLFSCCLATVRSDIIIDLALLILWMLSIMQAMKVENMVKLKEEFDYKSLCRRLEAELDRLVAENERQVKAREDTEDDSARSLEEARQSVFEAERKLASALEVC